MSAPRGTRRAGSPRGPAPTTRAGRSWADAAKGAWVAALLLALHLGMAGWGAVRNSVTFDENFHLSSGVAVVARRDFMVSPVNPPLVKSLQAAAALAAGARVPPGREWVRHGQYEAGAAFLRANADRYHRVYLAARCVTLALSMVLALVVMACARALFGPAAGLLALALYALTPEALAHGGLATLDTATALGWLATVAAGWRYSTSGSWRWWWVTAGALSFALLTRLTSLALLPLLPLLAAVATWRRPDRRIGRLAAGLVLLLPVAVAALWVGYLGQVSFAPLRSLPFESDRFETIARALPELRLPLPDAWLAGLDHQSFEGQAGITPTFLFGRILTQRVPFYFPLAIGLKWPIELLALLVLACAAMFRRAERPWQDEACFVLPPAAYLLAAMFVVQLNAGVRYVLPVLPFVCVLSSSVVCAVPRGGRWRSGVALAAVLGLAIETASVAPWYLTSFNPFAGAPAVHDRALNDSNVDWGQGLLALRDEMRARGIHRIHLAYHGTTDPAVYGIDYVPYLGGVPGPQSDWLAMSSYYRVGLSQHMVTPTGRTDFVRFDTRAFDSLEPVARPARCMYLYRMR